MTVLVHFLAKANFRCPIGSLVGPVTFVPRMESSSVRLDSNEAEIRCNSVRGVYLEVIDLGLYRAPRCCPLSLYRPHARRGSLTSYRQGI